MLLAACNLDCHFHSRDLVRSTSSTSAWDGEGKQLLLSNQLASKPRMQVHWNRQKRYHVWRSLKQCRFLTKMSTATIMTRLKLLLALEAVSLPWQGLLALVCLHRSGSIGFCWHRLARCVVRLPHVWFLEIRRKRRLTTQRQERQSSEEGDWPRQALEGNHDHYPDKDKCTNNMTEAIVLVYLMRWGSGVTVIRPEIFRLVNCFLQKFHTLQSPICLFSSLYHCEDVSNFLL